MDLYKLKFIIINFSIKKYDFYLNEIENYQNLF